MRRSRPGHAAHEHAHHRHGRPSHRALQWLGGERHRGRVLDRDAGKSAHEPFVFFAAVLAVYLAITWASTAVFDRLERRHARWAADAR